MSNDPSTYVYGIFADVYEQEKGVDPTTAANNMLKVDPEQKITISQSEILTACPGTRS